MPNVKHKDSKFSVNNKYVNGLKSIGKLSNNKWQNNTNQFAIIHKGKDGNINSVKNKNSFFKDNTMSKKSYDDMNSTTSIKEKNIDFINMNESLNKSNINNKLLQTR